MASTDSAILGSDLIPDQALKLPENDAFDYQPIADRIADLSCRAETPVNIALFAPWGSGKSSLATLIEASLGSRRPPVKLIRYDAWRYGGRGLRRNFIAHAAKELKIPEDEPRFSGFHRGLYEDQRRVSLNFPRVLREIRQGRLSPVILVALGAVFLGLLLSLSTIIVAAVVSTVLALIAAVVEAGKVVVERSRPSEDEEFSQRFARLVDLATHEPPGRGASERWRLQAAGWRASLLDKLCYYRLALWWKGELAAQPVRRPPRYERLIFFVDELDRCSPDDIAETLKALRTFLDADDCVFLVAADRDVIEAALPKVEQSTPVDQEKPYYTTRGAYLDKIFSHQITLPPQRSRSLAKFARQLTSEAEEGIWRELVELDSSQEGTRELDLVLYTLIPSHVYSPRRIKVLLNNFATNARMAASRLPGAWPARRLEIARLTAFQTEFPDFAEDLSHEPRLPRFLLDRSPDPETGVPATQLTSTLLQRWRLEPEDVAESDEEEPAEPDQLMAPEDEDQQEERRHREKTNRRRRQELRRYLERTHDVVGDLGRDLFYLRSAGLDVGLQDAELAELIEIEATDSPERVIDALADRSPSELDGAARLLSSIVDDVLGPEQTGVMTALMSAVDRLGPDLSIDVARTVLGALRTYRTANELEDEHLLGAVHVALAVRPEQPDMVRELLDEPGFFANLEWLTAVIALTAELHDDELPRLQRAISDWLPDDYEPVLDALTALPEAQQLRLMDDERIFEAIGVAIGQEGGGEGQDEAEQGEGQ